MYVVMVACVQCGKIKSNLLKTFTYNVFVWFVRFEILKIEVKNLFMCEIVKFDCNKM